MGTSWFSEDVLGIRVAHRSVWHRPVRWTHPPCRRRCYGRPRAPRRGQAESVGLGDGNLGPLVTDWDGKSPATPFGCGSKPMGYHFGVGAPPIFEPILVGIGMFTGGTGFWYPWPLCSKFPMLHSCCTYYRKQASSMILTRFSNLFRDGGDIVRQPREPNMNCGLLCTLFLRTLTIPTKTEEITDVPLCEGFRQLTLVFPNGMPVDSFEV